jgi:hypothetical protein
MLSCLPFKISEVLKKQAREQSVTEQSRDCLSCFYYSRNLPLWLGEQEDEMSESEVARLLKEIELTYQAAKNGLTGLTAGTARHDFITAKMGQLDQYRESLAHIVGADQAMEMLVQVIENV